MGEVGHVTDAPYRMTPSWSNLHIERSSFKSKHLFRQTQQTGNESNFVYTRKLRRVEPGTQSEPHRSVMVTRSRTLHIET